MHAVKTEQAFIFGSMAKGTDRADIDVDGMIVGGVSADEIAQIVEEASRKLGRDVHVNVHPREEWDELRRLDPVVRSIERGSRVELVVIPIMR